MLPVDSLEDARCFPIQVDVNNIYLIKCYKRVFGGVDL